MGSLLPTTTLTNLALSIFLGWLSAMKTKRFDCVQMKRQGAAKVREQTATLTREQELRFWQERSQYLRQRQAALKTVVQPAQ